MTQYYHNTKDIVKTKMVDKQKFKRSGFSYQKYVSNVLDNVYLNSVEDYGIPTNYPGANRQAPYMGTGLYCYMEYDDAKKHDTRYGREVVTVELDDEADVYDMDEKLTRADILKYLKYIRNTYIPEHMPTEEQQNPWRLIVTILIIEFYNSFEKYPETVGLVRYVIENFYPKLQIDVYKKINYDKINKKEVCYILVTNNNCIKLIS